MERYLRKCQNLGFDIVEISFGFLSIPPDDSLRVVDLVYSHGLKANPELGSNLVLVEIQLAQIWSQ
jgi:phosphosulfolactate synthase (CoM biosynthesis protein A)